MGEATIQEEVAALKVELAKAINAFMERADIAVVRVEVSMVDVTHAGGARMETAIGRMEVDVGA